MENEMKIGIWRTELARGRQKPTNSPKIHSENIIDAKRKMKTHIQRRGRCCVEEVDERWRERCCVEEDDGRWRGRQWKWWRRWEKEEENDYLEKTMEIRGRKKNHVESGYLGKKMKIRGRKIKSREKNGKGKWNRKRIEKRKRKTIKRIERKEK